MMQDVGQTASTLLACLIALGAGASVAACTPFESPPPQPAPSATPSAPTPTPSGEARCQDDFTAQVEWGTDPAAPSTAYLALTNSGAAACPLSGFPSEAAFLSASGPIETVG